MIGKIGERSPNLGVSEWVQGEQTNLDKELGNVILVEIFQVNCPGCFLHALPQAIDLYTRYQDQGLQVLGIATAFEDYDKNTLDNLKLLAKTGKVIGETKKALSMHGQLAAGERLPYQIPFPLGMDSLVETNGKIGEKDIAIFIKEQIPNFESQTEAAKMSMVHQVREYLESKKYFAETFETFSLRGTPSSILVDRKGILRHVSFGQTGGLETKIQELL